MSKFQRHFFVCVNQRPDGGKGSCAGRGAQAIVSALVAGLSEHPALWSSVSVTPTGCLGPCTEGPTIVVYPEGVWYVGVRLEDVPELLAEHLVGGRPVERLRYYWPDS
jgi:(2Fe-2S) ferredoxin